MNPRHLLILLAVCLLAVSVQAWGVGMGAWDYRKEFTINNTGSNLTNYQMMFTVNRSAGSDSGTTVYLNGKCEADYDDIRFVASDDTTVLDYWIESSSSTVASVWVELDSLPTGDTDFYLYYGNSGASAVSNGTNTFGFFDDFPGSSLDTSKWTSTSPDTLEVSGSILHIAHSAAAVKGIYAKTSFGTNYALRSKWKKIDDDYPMIGWDQRIPATGSKRAIFIGVDEGPKLGWTTEVYNTAQSRAYYGATDTNYHIIDFIRNGTTSAFAKIDGATAGTVTTNIPADSIAPSVGCYTGGEQYVDWFLIRKYTATEPTVGTWGSEETSQIVSLFSDFSGVPASGYTPLTVYFTDESTSENCTISTWQWSFGDSSPNSTQQNPVHTYTTSGLYSVILTVTNTSFSRTNTTQKTSYINATANLDAPNADFTVTETCGESTDTFYFIDFSTGGGLYAWNWSFGDGAYSELRNPTHQYAGNGTYDVNLTVWGAYGMDSLLRSNLITIPCGAPTPTPTPTGNVTPTPTGTPGNVTEGNITYIYAPDQDYVPFPIWLAIVIVSIALFGHSIIFLRNSDLTAMMAAVFAFVSAWLSNMIGYIDVQVTYIAEEILISPVIQAVHPPWLVYTMLLFALVSVVNIFAAIYKVYLKPTPWNEIYNRKLPKWRNR